jgi:hypothetical protein
MGLNMNYISSPREINDPAAGDRQRRGPREKSDRSASATPRRSFRKERALLGPVSNRGCHRPAGYRPEVLAQRWLHWSVS